MSENKSELKPLCRGNRTDRGWTADEVTGNWTPSIHDRRRVAVAEMAMAMEASEAVSMPGAKVAEILIRHSVSPSDWHELGENFAAWMKANQAG